MGGHPNTSAQVKGDAVDIGPSGAAAWLSEHGAAYGLCQIYANEPSHYELRSEAGDHGCPAVYADATHDQGCSTDQHARNRSWCQGNRHAKE
jgi:zinc D-Ala-D-Ala carboxypeptidase